MFRLTENVYCAFCKLKHVVYRAKHVHWTNVLLAAGLSFLMMWGFFQGVDGRVVVFFSAFIIVAETFVYFRWRFSLRCPHCAFDPILYKTDRKKCVAVVRSHLDELQKSGKYLLRQNNPFQNLPVRTASDSAPKEKTAPTGKSHQGLMSRQV
jgi:hypothetical protein